MRIVSIITLTLAVFAFGCAEPVNPAFPITSDQAHRALEEMREHPKPLERPLVIVGGFLDPNLSPPFFSFIFHSVTKDAKIITVSIGLCGSFEQCRRAVLDAVNQACPTTDRDWTAQVDVVGASLGGLAARYAAAPPRGGTPGQRLNIAHLYTISSPLSGAKLADVLGFSDYHRDIQDNSAFHKYLSSEDAHAKYELISYVHLNDEIVGDKKAAAEGQNPYWLANDSLLGPHVAAMVDARILADIARHLRGEETFTRPPPTPVP